MPEHLFVRFDEQHPAFVDPGNMLGRIRALDWSQSAAGPIDAWADEIKSAVRLILLSCSPMAVLIGPEGVVVQNDALFETLGDRYANALGHPVTAALPPVAGFFRDAIAACYEGKGMRFVDQPVKLARGGGVATAWFSLSFTPIADIQGNIYGVLIVASETTERTRALRALEQSKRRMEIALDGGGIVGIWDMDVRTDQVTIEGAFGDLFGISEKEARSGVDVDTLASAIDPRDRDRAVAELRAAIASGSDYRCRYRGMTGGGNVRWFAASGRPTRDERGRVVQFAGIIIDITEQTETAAALEQSNLRFDILAESIPQIIWSTDSEGRHDYFNRRWSEFTGIALSDIKPDTWENLVHPEDRDRVSREWEECLKTGKTYDINYRFRYHDGSYRWLWAMAVALRNADGSIVRWYGTSTDIDAPKQVEEQREIVSRELDHRIKNLFALVNGLVSLSVREQPEHQPLADTLHARLDALNRAHGLIRGAAQEGPPTLRRLLKQLLEPYDEKGSDRISIAGTDVPLDSRATTSVALVFHELITNAAKYGGLSHTGGTLHIAMHGDGDYQTIVWDERLAVAKDGEIVEGFGSRLLKAMVEGQLRGTIIRDLTPAGLMTCIRIPRTVLSGAPRSKA